MRLNRHVATVAAAMLLVVPAAATAAEAPLLSGYGGPGAGEQKLIGATLIGGGHGGGPGSPGGGPSSPGGGPGSPGGGSSSAAGSPSEGGRSNTARISAEEGGHAQAARQGSRGNSQLGEPRQSRGPAAEGHRQSRHAGSSTAQPARHASQPGSVSRPQLQASRAATNAASQSLALGLSSGQILLVVLLALGLFFVGLATWALARLKWDRDPADTDVMRITSR